MPQPPSSHDEHVASQPAAHARAPVSRGSCGEVFLAFLRLGLTSFGGPAAHLGYLRAEFVDRRRWLNDYAYSDLVALCQFLPGPASSQLGMALGLRRAGWAGMLAAWLAFTLPSALLMALLGLGLAGNAWLVQTGAVRGLQIAALAVLAQALWGMGRTLCPDRLRAGLAIAAALMCLALPGPASQLSALLLGAIAGMALLDVAPRPQFGDTAPVVPRAAAFAAMALFAALFVVLPVWSVGSGSALAAQVWGVYRAGALVFGGGHVVLPLLESTAQATGMPSGPEFLAGYGAAQAMPGPLFSFAAFLGAASSGPLGALALLAAIFLPGMLLLVAALPFWENLRRRPGARNLLAGVNASVVGLLLAALYDPVWTGAIHGKADFALALGLFSLLVYARCPPFWVAVMGAASGALLGWMPS